MSLIKAVKENDIEKVESLIDNDYYVNYVNRHGRTALMYACRYPDQRITKMLIQAGTNVNIIDEIGWTALMHACDYENWKMIYHLLRAGAIVSPYSTDGRYFIRYLWKYKRDILRFAESDL